MKKEKIYFVGFLKAGKKVVVCCALNKDCLSPQLWQYFGERITTKKRLNTLKQDLLREINASFKTDFKYIQIT